MPPKYFSDKGDQPPFLKALAEVRRIGVHEGWCYHHVQAIMMSIDQYAEAATGRQLHRSGLDSATAELLLLRKRAELEDPLKREPSKPKGEFFSNRQKGEFPLFCSCKLGE